MHKPILKVKRLETRQRFVDVWNNIEQYVSFEHVQRRQAETVRKIEKACRGCRSAIAYSGGKDAVVLKHLANLAGVRQGVMCYMGELEFPVFRRWIHDKCYPDIEVVTLPKYDFQWYAENEQQILATNTYGAYDNFWFSNTLWKPQDKYVKDNGIEVFMYGRRTKDGNYCGKNGIYVKAGTIRYNPISDWSHEEVFGYCHYFGIELAPHYYFAEYPELEWQFMILGTTSWAKLGVKASCVDPIHSKWHVLYQIDPVILNEASVAGVQSAIKYLEGAPYDS